MKRPFWLHQVVDYILGIMVMAQATKADSPLVPLVIGLFMLINAACVNGPLAAYRGLSRPGHRIADLVLWAAIVVVAALGLGVSGGIRVTLLIVAVIWAVVIFNTNFAVPVPREKLPPAQRSEAVGRMAGRAVAGGVNAWRRRRDDRT